MEPRLTTKLTVGPNLGARICIHNPIHKDVWNRFMEVLFPRLILTAAVSKPQKWFTSGRSMGCRLFVYLCDAFPPAPLSSCLPGTLPAITAVCLASRRTRIERQRRVSRKGTLSPAAEARLGASSLLTYYSVRGGRVCSLKRVGPSKVMFEVSLCARPHLP